MLVVTTRATNADCKKITGALLGGSTRRLISTAEYIGLPTAVNSLDGSSEVVTELEKCKKITRNYFQALYHHDKPPELPKPWMECLSVSNVKNGCNILILQGELISLIMGLLMALAKNSSMMLYLDHMNLVRFIKDVRSRILQETRLHSINKRSYYRWIASLISRSRMSVRHTKSHTDGMDLPLLLNNKVDHYASNVQSPTHLLSFAPVPTFLMEEYAFVCKYDRWILCLC